MKTAWRIGIVALFAAGLQVSPVAAQSELDRLESGIRSSNGPASPAAAVGQRVYLGAFADDDAGRGVRILSVRAGGPADRAGLKPQDLVVSASGRKIRLLSDLTAVLGGLSPGDRMSLEVNRGNQTVKTEVVVTAPSGAAPAGQPAVPPLPGNVTWPSGGAAPPAIPAPSAYGSIPAPPAMPGPADGPRLIAPSPQPAPSSNSQAEIDELRHRVDQLERKVQELERALAEQRK